MYRGKPIRLHWMGWHSDTYRLREWGWEFAESESHYAHQERENYLRFRNVKADCVGQTQPFPYSPHARPHELRRRMRGIELGCTMAHRLIEPTHGESRQAYMSVDTEPVMHSVDVKQDDVFHATYFRPSYHDAKQIFLAKATMGEVIEVALSKQEPEQAKIRARMMKDQEIAEYSRASTVSAQLRLIG